MSSGLAERALHQPRIDFSGYGIEGVGRKSNGCPQIGRDRARGDGIDAYALRREFRSQGLRKGFERSLAGAIDCQPWEAHLRQKGGNELDRATFADVRHKKATCLFMAELHRQKGPGAQ